MDLYHFTSPKHLDGCLQQGIRFGRIPMRQLGQTRLIAGYQWLTRYDGFNQSWNQYSTLPYDRTAFRLTVDIRRPYNLIEWADFCRIYKNELEQDLNRYGDPENWYLYHGSIPPDWITAVLEKSKSKAPLIHAVRGA